MDVFLNRIDIDNSFFDYEKINTLYDFFLIENKGNSFKPDSDILYEPLIKKNVLAIQYTAGSSFIMLLKKDRLNKSIILEVIEKFNKDNDNNLSQRQLFAPFEKFPHSMIQLFFNSLAKSSSNNNCSNIAGKLYYFSEMRSKQIYCVELKINSDYSYELKSKTFTEALEKSKQKRYILQANNTLSPAAENEKQKTYVEFQYKNTKHSVTFLETRTLQAFEACKTGIFERLKQKFDKSYADIIKLNFMTESAWNKLDIRSSASQKISHIHYLSKVLQGNTLNIVDKIGDSASKYFCEQLKAAYENLFNTVGLQIKHSSDFVKNALNICIIHNKSYYETNADEKDPYENSFKYVIQNVTIEDFSQGKKHEISEAACLVLINELIVKKDLLQNHKITITSWASYGFSSVVTFCWYEKEIINEKTNEGINHYYFMEIAPDGSFVIGEKSKDLFNQEKFEKIEEIFELNNMKAERHNKYNEKYKGLILNDKEEINIIQDTPFFMMPNSLLIYKDLKVGKISRKKDDLIKYFSGCLDIYYKTKENCIYYSSGQIGSGMNTSISRASHIRKIIPYKYAPLFFQDYIETMNVTFVRNGQLTVIPFPFKYLRECAKLIRENNNRRS